MEDCLKCGSKIYTREPYKNSYIPPIYVEFCELCKDKPIDQANNIEFRLRVMSRLDEMDRKIGFMLERLRGRFGFDI